MRERPRHTARTLFLTALAGLAFCLLAALVAAPVPAAQAASLDYGSLSRKYETGGDPTAADSYWGYGAYQMLSDTAQEYAAWLAAKSNATYKSWGEGLQAAHAQDSSGSNLYFNAMWRYVAGTDLPKLSSSDRKRVNKVLGGASVEKGSRKKALKLQYDFTVKTYYKPALKYWKKLAPEFAEADYSVALRSVIFSCAVAAGPYGSAENILKPTLKTLGGWGKGLSERKVITALYDERSKVVSKAPGKPAHKIAKTDPNAVKYKLVGKYLKHYYSSTGAVQVAVYKRFRYDEKEDALKLLSTCESCKHAKTTGGKVTRYYDLTDATHREKRSAKTCTICGKVVQKAGSFKVDNVFVMSGASYKDKSGRAYTVHEKGYYAAGSAGAALRKSAKASSKALLTLRAGKAVRVRKASLGADGFWWGAVTCSGKSGWVRMDSLGRLGTASIHDHGKKTTCRYCGLTTGQEKSIARIVEAAGKGKVACAFSRAGTSYSAAYAEKGLAGKARAKGATVTVVKVVRNAFDDYWVRLSDGSYADLRLLSLARK